MEINLLHMDFVKECFRRTYAAKDRFHLAELNPPAPSHPVLTEVFDRYEKQDVTSGVIGHHLIILYLTKREETNYITN